VAAIGLAFKMVGKVIIKNPRDVGDVDADFDKNGHGVRLLIER
jgi:hypothetical protein